MSHFDGALFDANGAQMTSASYVSKRKMLQRPPAHTRVSGHKRRAPVTPSAANVCICSPRSDAPPSGFIATPVWDLCKRLRYGGGGIVQYHNPAAVGTNTRPYRHDDMRMERGAKTLSQAGSDEDENEEEEEKPDEVEANIKQRQRRVVAPEEETAATPAANQPGTNNAANDNGDNDAADDDGSDYNDVLEGSIAWYRQKTHSAAVLHDMLLMNAGTGMLMTIDPFATCRCGADDPTVPLWWGDHILGSLRSPIDRLIMFTSREWCAEYMDESVCGNFEKDAGAADTRLRLEAVHTLCHRVHQRSYDALIAILPAVLIDVITRQYLWAAPYAKPLAETKDGTAEWRAQIPPAVIDTAVTARRVYWKRFIHHVGRDDIEEDQDRTRGRFAVSLRGVSSTGFAFDPEWSNMTSAQKLAKVATDHDQFIGVLLGGGDHGVARGVPLPQQLPPPQHLLLHDHDAEDDHDTVAGSNDDEP